MQLLNKNSRKKFDLWEAFAYFLVMRYLMRFIALFTHYFLQMNVQAQSNKFDSLWDGLTFNIYTDNPDTVVLPFLKNHFPC